jgi:hypothetical protein
MKYLMMGYRRANGGVNRWHPFVQAIRAGEWQRRRDTRDYPAIGPNEIPQSPSPTRQPLLRIGQTRSQTNLVNSPYP